MRPSIVDAGGKNVFAEAEGSASAGTEAQSKDEENIYAASTEKAPYQPSYEVSQKHRSGLLLTLAILGLTGAILGGSSIVGLLAIGWVLAVIAIVPSVCAWLLGTQDIRAMKLGAMDAAGLQMTRVAVWLGVLGIFCSLGMVALTVYFALFFLIQIA